MQAVHLTTRNLAQAIRFYQTHLQAEVVTQGSTDAVLRITEQQLMLTLSLVSYALGSNLSTLCLKLTQPLLDKMSRNPGIFFRPYIAVRSSSKHRLPLELQDPDGHRWYICIG